MANSPIDQVEQMIAFGQYWDALQHCNTLIDQAGRHAEVRLYRLRATTELNLGMAKECIRDATYILKHTKEPREIENAYRLRINSNLKVGNYEDSRKDCAVLGDRHSLHEIESLIQQVTKAEEAYKAGRYDEAIGPLDLAISNSPKATKFVLMRSNIAFERGDFSRFQAITDPIMDEFASDPNINYKRGIVSMCQNNIDDAVKRLQTATKLRGAPKNASLALAQIRELSKLFGAAQSILDRSLSQKTDRSLSKRDSDVAEKTVQKLREQGSTFCPAGSEIMQKADLIEARLFRAKGWDDKALEILDKALDGQSTGLDDLHLERGEINFEKHNWDQAIFDFQTVAAKGGNRRAQQLLNEAQAEKKKADRVDFYAELGIDEHASHEEIASAYRKCVRKYHPDQFGDKVKKAEAEAKMKKVNIAYDVLGDEQKRRMYDLGQDPESPGGGPGFGNPMDLFNMFTGFNFPFGNAGGGEDTGFQHFEFGNGGNGFHFEVHFG